MAEKSAYSCIATHDQDLIDKLLNWIRKNNISKKPVRISITIRSANARKT